MTRYLVYRHGANAAKIDREALTPVPPCPRCGGRQLADGVCADSVCDAREANRGWHLDRYF